MKLMSTLFEGGPDLLVADRFIDRVEKHVNAMNLATDKLKITLTIYNFVGDTKIWWKTISHTHNLDTMTYDTFKKLYYKKYFPTPKRRELKKEFDGLKQENMAVTEYENKFTSLLRFALGIANDEEGKIEKFVDGLDLTIRPIIAASDPTEYAKAVRKALVVKAKSKDSKAIRESYKHNRSMSAISEGQSSKKQKNEQSWFRGQQPDPHPQLQYLWGLLDRMLLVSDTGSRDISCPSALRLRQGWRSTAKADAVYHSSVRVLTATTTSAISANYDSPEFSTGQRDFFECTHSAVRLSKMAHVLFDSGVSYSFIASSFARALGLEVSQLDRPLCVDTPIGGSVTLGRVCRGCSIIITGQVPEFDLILLEMTGFDIILGMDWLLSFRAVIDYFRGRVSVCTPDGDCFCFVGDRGCARNFLDVFPEDLTELPPYREVEFAINLMLGTALIFMAPQKRWVEFLKEYNFDSQYHPGKVNVVADALSRKSRGTLARLAIRKWKMFEDFAKMGLYCFDDDVGSELVFLFSLVAQPTLGGRVIELQRQDPNLDVIHTLISGGETVND
ncbi:uncharacterized protein LOC132281778 [Cornus florida]|uniref:uncharacterized protein LOC132281778 n=1 Tax=Cornus florida TaxID=4283 RepID=UPI00289EB830|nr:uncharacterized protein LOC132281778 [Cornus florida]